MWDDNCVSANCRFLCKQVGVGSSTLEGGNHCIVELQLQSVRGVECKCWIVDGEAKFDDKSRALVI